MRRRLLAAAALAALWAEGRVWGGLNAAVGAAGTRHGWQHVSGMFDEFTNHGYCAANPSRWVCTIPESLTGQYDPLGAFPSTSGSARLRATPGGRAAAPARCAVSVRAWPRGRR